MAFRAEPHGLFRYFVRNKVSQSAWLACSVAIRGRHAQSQKEPPRRTHQPFVPSFATYLQAAQNITLGHTDCRWLPPQT